MEEGGCEKRKKKKVKEKIQVDMKEEKKKKVKGKTNKEKMESRKSLYRRKAAFLQWQMSTRSDKNIRKSEKHEEAIEEFDYFKDEKLAIKAFAKYVEDVKTNRTRTIRKRMTALETEKDKLFTSEGVERISLQMSVDRKEEEIKKLSGALVDVDSTIVKISNYIPAIVKELTQCMGRCIDNDKNSKYIPEVVFSDFLGSIKRVLDDAVLISRRVSYDFEYKTRLFLSEWVDLLLLFVDKSQTSIKDSTISTPMVEYLTSRIKTQKLELGV